jgi:phage I-like protein
VPRLAGRAHRREDRHALITFPTPLAGYVLHAATDAAPAMSWIQVALASPIEPRGLTITAADLRQMAENFRSGKYPEPPTRICVDYEHLSLKPTKPGDGKAAGWIVELELREHDTELWAKVEWTPAGAEAIRGKEYQFISPVIASGFVTNAGEKIGTTLLNAALTNNPQLQGMAPVSLTRVRALVQLGDGDRRARVHDAICARAMNPFDPQDDCSLIELYGETAVFWKDGRYYQVGYTIAEDGEVTLNGDPLEVVATFTPLTRTAMPKTFTLTIDGKPVQIPEDALEQTDVVKALRAQIPPADAKVVNAAAFEGLTTQVATLSTQVTTLTATVQTEKARADQAEATLKGDRAKASVQTLVQAGKLTPAQREWAEKYCLADPAGFETFAQTLPVVVALGREVGSPQGAAAGDAYAQLEAHAKALQAATPALSNAQAFTAAMAAHPELYAAYERQAGRQ